MLKNGQIYFENLTVKTLQHFKSMFGHFSTLCLKELGNKNRKKLSVQIYTNGSDASIFSHLPPAILKNKMGNKTQ